MREDKEAAMREYRNIFTSEGGDGQIIKRADIIRNSVTRPPKLRNEDGDSLWGLMYDPARSKDNSVIFIPEYYKDPIVGWKMRVQNVVNLINLEKKNKKGVDIKINVSNSVANVDLCEETGILNLTLKSGQGSEIRSMRADDFMGLVFPNVHFDIVREKYLDINFKEI